MQVLIATMGQTANDYSLLDSAKICSDAIVCNQCEREGIEQFLYHGRHIIWINTTERGLSKSRNMALRYASSDICLLADDDESLADGYETIIEDAFKQQKDAQVMCFQVRKNHALYKAYRSTACKLRYISSMKVSSVEIAFRRKSWVEMGITFDEQIGAGAEFFMGEENVLLFLCLRKRLNIWYYPIEIAELGERESTWFCGFNQQYFIARGGAFTAASRLMSPLLILQFAIRHRALCASGVGVNAAIKYMLAGRRKYLCASDGHDRSGTLDPQTRRR